MMASPQTERRVTPSSADPPVLRFAGHLHYPLRECWIVKGLQALAEAERSGDAASLFSYPAATDRFGIGPAMVQALRFWLRATGVMVELPGQSVRRIPTLTLLGRLLQQADPYLERPGSVWLLHAHLARSFCQTPVFAWFFQHFVNVSTSFSKQRCVEACQRWAIKEAPTQDICVAAVRSDIECLLRMYLPARLLSPEHQLATSPFHRLGLLRALPAQLKLERGATGERAPVCYGFRPPQSDEIPALVVLAVLLEWAGASLPLRDLLFGPGHIGRTFGLSQGVLFDLFTSLRSSVPAWCLRVERRGPQKWVSVPDVPVAQVLHAYYAQR